MLDQTINIEDGLIHHGKQNNRIYVMKTPSTRHHEFILRIEDLAAKNNYEKIIAKVPESIQEEFIKQGYSEEAKVPYFYIGEGSCSFMSKYICLERKNVRNRKVIKQVLRIAQKIMGIPYVPIMKSDFICRKADEKDITHMVSLYKKVFITYPFPIHEEEYIKRTMEENVMYFGIWHNEVLVALASSEVDVKNKNAEMTDFAVAPECRGQNISSILLQVMEEEMKACGIQLAYTIARAVSYGMNCTFAKNGYTFSGTLFNNTHIAGNIESMNVWYKKL